MKKFASLFITGMVFSYSCWAEGVPNAGATEAWATARPSLSNDSASETNNLVVLNDTNPLGDSSAPAPVSDASALADKMSSEIDAQLQSSTQNAPIQSANNEPSEKLQSKASSVDADSHTGGAPVVTAVESLPADNVTSSLAQERAIDIPNNMKIVSHVKHQEDEVMHYKVDANYPQVSGAILTPGAKQFNQAVESVVNDELMHFKRLVTMDVPHMKTLPEGMQKNSLKVDYDVDVVKPKNSPIVSVRLSFEGMQAGRAHPYHSNRVVNVDLTTGKVLALNDLFKKNSQFLKLLAAYSNRSLNSKLKNDNWMVAQGTKADPKNFKNWNLQADSLLITFDEYQVAPYVYGKQEVEVPYKELAKILADKTPISDCAKNSVSCQVG